MPFLRRCFVLFLAVGPLAALAAQPAAACAIPDPESGAIGDQRAIMLLPKDALTASDQKAALADCEAHIVPVTDYSEDVVHPCGQWFLPERGRYLVWVERGNEISQQSLLRWAAEKFEGRGLVVSFPLRPAGRVDVPPQLPDRASTIRIMHLQMDGRGFERRVRAGSRSVRVPVGPVVGGIFDRAGDALALSQPFTVKHAQTTLLEARPPCSGTDVLASVVLPQSLRRKSAGSIWLDAAGTNREPAVSVRSPERLIGIWYGVEGTAARLTGEPESLCPRPSTGPTGTRTLRLPGIFDRAGDALALSQPFTGDEQREQGEHP